MNPATLPRGLAEKRTYESVPAAHGIMFHHFHGGHHLAGQGALSADELAAMIEFLGRKRILPAPEWLHRAASGSLRDTDLCITLDDGLRCQFDIALPVLQHYGIQAFWFVYTSALQGKAELLELCRYYRTVMFEDVDDFYRQFQAFVLARSPEAENPRPGAPAFPLSYLAEFPFYSLADRQFRWLRDEVLGPEPYARTMREMMRETGFDMACASAQLWMDDAQLRQLRDCGHVIGLHSHTHPTRLERLAPCQQRREYQDNWAYLEHALGTPPRTMSHPCNSYNRDTLQILRAMGIEVGFRSNMVTARQHTALEYPREDSANLLAMMKAE